MISPSEIKELLDYDPDIGAFFWRPRSIRANGKRISLGYYRDRAKAEAARETAEIALHGNYRRSA